MTGDRGGFFWQRYNLKTRFNDIAGLKAGVAGADASGIEVGLVKAWIEFVGTEKSI